jgi:hypothetical protein
MAQGVSIHIGLNHVDPKHYQGWDGALNACVADAKDMCALAKKKGFTGNTLLLNEQATAAAVTAALQDASKKLGKGDILFLTYSGHGGQVRDTNADEKDNDRMDETWVLFDREFVDDELYNLWSKFKPGVRILVLSDSCHSGTVTRDIPIFVGGGPKPRAMPREIESKQKMPIAPFIARSRKRIAARKKPKWRRVSCWCPVAWTTKPLWMAITTVPSPAP